MVVLLQTECLQEIFPFNPNNVFPNQNFPAANFDFFPFCGIQRPVILYSKPRHGINDLTIVTDIDGTTGVVRVDLKTEAVGQVTRARITLKGHGAQIAFECVPQQTRAMPLCVLQARFWSPEEPALYHLVIELVQDGVVFDRYSLEIGIRTIKIDGDRLLLNGQPVVLKGFGRHEDFPVVGRGLMPAVIVKDYELMRWIGANSFRTTHYPYSDEMMDLADRLGFMVIDETPGVGLFFDQEGLEKRFGPLPAIHPRTDQSG